MATVAELISRLSGLDPHAEIFMYLEESEEGAKWHGDITVNDDPFYYKGDSPVRGETSYVILSGWS